MAIGINPELQASHLPIGDVARGLCRTVLLSRVVDIGQNLPEASTPGDSLVVQGDAAGTHIELQIGCEPQSDTPGRVVVDIFNDEQGGYLQGIKASTTCQAEGQSSPRRYNSHRDRVKGTNESGSNDMSLFEVWLLMGVVRRMAKANDRLSRKS